MNKCINDSYWHAKVVVLDIHFLTLTVEKMSIRGWRRWVWWGRWTWGQIGNFTFVWKPQGYFRPFTWN